MTADFMAVGLTYFTQGALGLAALAKPYLLKDELHLSPAEASILMSLTYWPWTLKPVWGFITDAFPIFGSRRKAYLVISGLISMCGWLGLGGLGPFSSDTKEEVILLMMLGNLGIAASDVVVDGLVVEKARGNDQLMGGLQAFSWGCRGVGAVLSAYFSGALLEIMSARAVLGLTAILPLLVVFASALIEEPPISKVSTKERKPVLIEVTEQGRAIWEIIRSPQILPTVIFISLWQMTPSAGSSTFYYYTNFLGFHPEFLGRTQLFGALASIFGIFLYNRVFSRMPLKDYLMRVNLAAVGLGLLPLILISRANVALGIPDQVFVLGDDTIQTVAGELAHMPVLVLAARLCPPGMEATLFALLMSVLNLSSFVASLVSSALTSLLHVTDQDFSNLGLLVLICNLSGLLPLALLSLVPDSSSATEQEVNSSR